MKGDLLAAVLLLLAGCGVESSKPRPPVEVPASRGCASPPAKLPAITTPEAVRGRHDWLDAQYPACAELQRRTREALDRALVR